VHAPTNQPEQAQKTGPLRRSGCYSNGLETTGQSLCRNGRSGSIQALSMGVPLDMQLDGNLLENIPSPVSHLAWLDNAR